MSVVVDLGGGEHHVAGAARRVEQRLVLARLGGLGELHVIGDLAYPGGPQAVDRAGVQRAREWPLNAQVAEGDVIDGHDHQLGGGLLGAQLEAEVDAVALQPGEDAEREAEQRQRGDGHADARQWGESSGTAPPAHGYSGASGARLRGSLTNSDARRGSSRLPP